MLTRLSSDVYGLLLSFLDWSDLSHVNGLKIHPEVFESHTLKRITSDFPNKTRLYSAEDVDWVLLELEFGPEEWTQTDACKEYKVTKAMLSEYPSKRKPNPTYRNAAPTVLYKQIDCIRACLLRHGTYQGLED